MLLMNPERDQLVPVAKEFYFLVHAPVRGNEVPRDLFERRIGAERYCPLIHEDAR
jgi:hypothetical protein